MTSQEPFKLAMIGCGGIAVAHLKAVEAQPDRLRLVAACDPLAVNRDTVAARMAPLGAVRMYEQMDAMLDAEADAVDGVLVLTPHVLHHPCAKRCVEAGLPVLVEKPATNTLDEALDLHQFAEARGVTVMVGQNVRFDPGMRWLRQWVSASPMNFGPLRSFEISGWQNIEGWSATKPDKNAGFWILDKKRAGGGVVVSLLVHNLDLMRYLFQTDYARVSASGRFDPPFKNGAESSACALLTTTGGAVGTLHANYLARKTPYCESFKAFGEHGVVGTHPTALGTYAGPAFCGTTAGRPADGWSFQTDGVEGVPASQLAAFEPHSFTAQLLAFADAVRGGYEPENSLRTNLNTLAPIDAIYRSMAEDGRAVDVPGLTATGGVR